MFDLDAELRRWREHHEPTSSLSPRELDELEDHLRARIDLLLETDAALAPEQAFAAARQELGKSAALSSEFAKSGKPRWRKLLVAGWAMYAVSFFLPVTHDFYWGAGPGARQGILWGWQAPIGALLAAGDGGFWQSLMRVLSGLSNALALATFLKLNGSRPPKSVWLPPALFGATLLNLQWIGRQLDPGIGYWVWVASFACIGSALWMRARERAPARSPTPVHASGEGAFE
ncbi:MAG: hypothetical protein F4087_14345 [Gemmatimonadetes bacterium]|nr:hypothetical protein [Gemmatimonadota bacterium]MYE70418.1 hypothetical protein [Gemmatimonadota bacterium]MYJ69669.1 hypothetical protein [Gemmatimonadota bacterium]